MTQDMVESGRDYELRLAFLATTSDSIQSFSLLQVYNYNTTTNTRN